MSDRLDFMVRNKEDLVNAVNEIGFLPFFANSIAGFSLEEHTAPEIWFTGGEGPWEWKGPVIRESGCAYGKFFGRKAAYISREWFPDFANYRRDGYDFDARFDDGLASYKDRALYELVEKNGPLLSKELKRLGNYKKGGNTGFDTMITRLQSQCYVVISDFVYLKDKKGCQYGWGVAKYATPEQFMGEGFTGKVYEREPEESYERILEHLCRQLGGVKTETVKMFLGRF